jgi:hypothetical protein
MLGYCLGYVGILGFSEANVSILGFSEANVGILGLSEANSMQAGGRSGRGLGAQPPASLELHGLSLYEKRKPLMQGRKLTKMSKS